MKYTHAAKTATGVDVDALLDAAVLRGGQKVTLRSQLTGTRTLLLFVRNGA